MLVDNGLRGGAILVETGGRHRQLDVADGLFALGDPGLEVVDAQPAGLLGLLQPPGFGIDAFLVLAGFAGRLRGFSGYCRHFDLSLLGPYLELCSSTLTFEL